LASALTVEVLLGSSQPGNAHGKPYLKKEREGV